MKIKGGVPSENIGQKSRTHEMTLERQGLWKVIVLHIVRKEIVSSFQWYLNFKHRFITIRVIPYFVPQGRESS